ncbi:MULTISPECIES: GNAT family N-acetyltransferase [Paenibacillus]|uniref:GNAT family N-acetyltransferase n=1 Tax=Paenibacillus TaxID=44249 RepID=UPI000C179D72|nr:MULTISPECIES: GNAT family protein [Paenibacillus]MDR9745633.1 GNAT family protein [Paenibacillus taichungensis]PIH60662.1 GNAT family N-acetyltransferase [Paenibacillus sp. LK1]
MDNREERIYLRFLNVEDAPTLLDLQFRNRAVFEEISASERSETFYTLEGQVALLEGWNKAREEGKRYSFGIFLNNTHELIGEISLFELELDSTAKWIVGYVLDQVQNGKGYMSDALRLALDFAMNEAGIKRVEAGALPDNAGSIRVLRKAGFQETDRQNIKIKGSWKEHVMFAVDLQ